MRLNAADAARLVVYIARTLTIGALLASASASAQGQTREQQLEDRIAKLNSLITPDTPANEVKRYRRLIRIFRKAQLPFAYSADGRLGGEDCREFIITPDREFTKDTLITCRKIIIPAGAHIRVTKESSLYLESGTIEVLGPAVIDGSGKKGSIGARGKSMEQEWSSRGDGDFYAALRDCRSNLSHPDRGKSGEQGVVGGDGAIIVFGSRAKHDDVLTVKYAAGAGGDGGPGGHGRLLKNGRNNYCDGCTMNCPSGDNGPPGEPGSEGDYVILK